MGYRVPVAVLLLLAGWGPMEAGAASVEANTVDAATKKCCPMFKESRMDEFGQCVHHFGVMPICDGNRRGCYYGSKFFRVGSTVKLTPSKCLKIVCTDVADKSDAASKTSVALGHVVASTAEVAQLQVKQISNGCGCCEYQGELYANGSWIHKDHTTCIRTVCYNGVWTDVGDEYHLSKEFLQEIYSEISSSRFDDGSDTLVLPEEEKTEVNPKRGLMEGPRSDLMRWSYNDDDHHTCCFHEGRYYFEGETIALYNKSYGNDCEKKICLKGRVTSCFFECCCIEGNKMHSCYSEKPLPSSDFETCTIRRCCDGFINEIHEPGCCSVDGQVYKPYQDIGYTDDECQMWKCVEGQVVLKDTGKCCYVNGHYIQSGKVVESNLGKCIFKVCQDAHVVDLSLDACPCCLYSNKLYSNGSSIKRECVELTCFNGQWKEKEHVCCDFCQIHTGTNYLTFDGVPYFHNGLCNITLVQDHYYGYNPTNFIALSFKTCGFPFSEKATCNDVLTVKHNYHTAVTFSSGGIIQVNGRTITELPYTEIYDLFIWETAFTYRVLTFDNLMVEYGKSTPPLVRVYTPDKNMGTLFGLCGQYDKTTYRDLRPRNAYSYFFTYSIEYFYNSWKTLESGCKGIIDWEEACTGVSSDRKEHIEDLCKARFTCGTDCGHNSLGAKAVQERCVSDLCYCLPDHEYKCLVLLEEELIHLCSSIGGNIHLQCRQQEGNTSSVSLDSLRNVKQAA